MGNALALGESAADLGALCIGGLRRAPELHAFGPNPCQSGASALAQQVALEFGDSGEHGHQHPAGGAVGTSLITTIWEWRAVFHRSRLVERIYDGYEPLVQARAALRAAGLPATQQLATIERWIDREAHTLAVTEMFYGSAVLFLMLIAVIWMGKRTVKRPAPSLGSSVSS